MKPSVNNYKISWTQNTKFIWNIFKKRTKIVTWIVSLVKLRLKNRQISNFQLGLISDPTIISIDFLWFYFSVYSLVFVSIVKTCASFFNSLLGVWNVVWNFVFDFPTPEMYNTKSFHCLTLISKVRYCCAFLLFKNWAAIYV